MAVTLTSLLSASWAEVMLSKSVFKTFTDDLRTVSSDSASAFSDCNALIAAVLASSNARTLSSSSCDAFSWLWVKETCAVCSFRDDSASAS